MNYIELLFELRQLDELTLVDLLGLTSDEIVDAFIDKIDEQQTKIRRAIQESQ